VLKKVYQNRGPRTLLLVAGAKKGRANCKTTCVDGKRVQDRDELRRGKRAVHDLSGLKGEKEEEWALFGEKK